MAVASHADRALGAFTQAVLRCASVVDPIALAVVRACVAALLWLPQDTATYDRPTGLSWFATGRRDVIRLSPDESTSEREIGRAMGILRAATLVLPVMVLMAVFMWIPAPSGTASAVIVLVFAAVMLRVLEVYDSVEIEVAEP